MQSNKKNISYSFKASNIQEIGGLPVSGGHISWFPCGKLLPSLYMKNEKKAFLRSSLSLPQNTCDYILLQRFQMHTDIQIIATYNLMEISLLIKVVDLQHISYPGRWFLCLHTLLRSYINCVFKFCFQSLSNQQLQAICTKTNRKGLHLSVAHLF